MTERSGMRKKHAYISFVVLSFILFSCSPKSIKPPDSDLYFSLEYVPKLERFTDKSRFSYVEGRVTDEFIPSGEYRQLIPYIGKFYFDNREYMPIFGFADADGFVVTDTIYSALDTFILSDSTELFIAALDHKDAVLIPQNGMWMIECTDYIRPIAYDNGLFGIVNEESDTKIYNADGVLHRLIEDICVYYGSDLYVVTSVSPNRSASVYRLMNLGGGRLSETDYYFFSGFRSGYASLSIKTSPVKKEYSAAVIDTLGNYVIAPTAYQLIDITTIDTGVMRVRDKDNKYGIIDIDGNELVPCQYPSLKIESASPLIFTTHDKRINYTDSTETEYKVNEPAPDFGEYDYSTVVCGYNCAVSDEYTYVFNSRGELLFKKLIHDTD